MALKRTKNNEHPIVRLTRKDKTTKITAHPGFMSISPRSSSTPTNSEESKRSDSQSGYIRNLMAPMSSHLLSSGFSNSITSKEYSKPSKSRSNPSDDHKSYQAERQSSSRYHYKCQSSVENLERPRGRGGSPTRGRVGSPTRARSKPSAPNSRGSSRTSSPQIHRDVTPPSRLNFNRDIRPDSTTPSLQEYNEEGTIRRDSRPPSQQDYTQDSNVRRDSRPPSQQDYTRDTITRRDSRPSSQQEYIQEAIRRDSRPSSQKNYSQEKTHRDSRQTSQDYTLDDITHSGSRPPSQQDYTPETTRRRSTPSSQLNSTQESFNYNSRPSSQQDYTKESINYQMKVLKEKYSKLKEDYNAKMEEVSTARVELESAIKDAVDKHKRCEVAEQKAADLILRVKEAEFDKIKCSSSRDRILEMENQFTVSKQKHIESMEDVEEARRILQQQLEAVHKMRQLYLETEQLAEEQSRKLGTLESENERLSEQTALSMDQAREQFHLQVFELGPLADSVSRLNESIMVNKGKIHRADKKAEELQSEILQLTSRNDELKAKLAEMREQSSKFDQEKNDLRGIIDRKQEERSVVKSENYSLRAKIKDLEEINSDKEAKITLRSGEVKDLSARLETLREECARQISTNQNTLMTARKSHLKRLTALEKDLAKTKADENAAEKERDEIRLRLEDQIVSLSQNLSQAQEKIRNLQDSLGYINKDRNVRVRRVSNPHALM